MSEEKRSLGRIEIAPEVLATIAHYAALRIEGVTKMAPIPADVARLFRRATKQDGIVLNIAEDNKVRFDIYLIMDPHANLMEASHKVQSAVAEAIDTMVGIPIDAINIHVEDVVYTKGELV